MAARQLRLSVPQGVPLDAALRQGAKAPGSPIAAWTVPRDDTGHRTRVWRALSAGPCLAKLARDTEPCTAAGRTKKRNHAVIRRWGIQRWPVVTINRTREGARRQFGKNIMR